MSPYFVVAKKWDGHEVLDIPNWSLSKNEKWVADGITNKQDFYAASPVKGNLWHTSGKYKGEPTVYATEMRQLQDAGYKKVGDYFVHPDNLINYFGK